jgi:hypothetical protein
MPFIGLYSNEGELNEGEWNFSMAMVCPWMPNGTIMQYLNTCQSPQADGFVPKSPQIDVFVRLCLQIGICSFTF